MSARRRSRALLLGAVALAVALVAALVLVIAGANGGSKGSGAPGAGAPGLAGASGFAGAALPQPPPASGFTLADTAGRPVSLSALRGKVVVLAFLSSACGRTCVLIAQQIRGALDELTTPAPALLVSVDPTADTPARRDAFLQAVSLRNRRAFCPGPPRGCARCGARTACSR